jgi:diacylglycerol kinase family enzyme
LHFTTSETSITELVENVFLPQANDGIDQSILLLSGDGGIVDIVNALLPSYRPDKYRKPSISLLPLGTGNAMANSAGVTGDSTLGLSMMLRGSPREVPLFRTTYSPGARLLVNQGQDERPLSGDFDGMPCAYGAVVCSWGLHATLVADSDTVEYRRFGAERFKMAGKEALFPSDGSLPHAYKGRVSIRRSEKSDWERIPRDEHGYVLATLVSQLEAGFTISPSSKPLDGKLRVVHFGQLSGQEAMEIMGKAYDGGKHISDERVGYEEIDGLRIDFDEEESRWRRICLDGKIIRVEKGGWVEVQGDAGGVVDLVSNP